jgi:hypothetical protein
MRGFSPFPGLLGHKSQVFATNNKLVRGPQIHLFGFISGPRYLQTTFLTSTSNTVVLGSYKSEIAPPLPLDR